MLVPVAAVLGVAMRVVDVIDVLFMRDRGVAAVVAVLVVQVAFMGLAVRT